MPLLRLGTRRSDLAQAQAEWVIRQLLSAFPDLQIEKVLITTTGDRQASEGFASRLPEVPGGLKALFTKEIEEALLDRCIDLAVHSLKDLAVDLPAGLCIAAIPRREDPHDAWISKRGMRFKDLPAHARIGTSSVRRQAQLRHLQPQWEIVPLRGNIDTRLRKLQEGDWDGIVLAVAGLRRLGREKEATEILPEDVMLPAIGQGCLALEARKEDRQVRQWVQFLDDSDSHHAALAERALLKALGGSCQTPIAAHATVSGDRLRLTGLVVSPSGKPYWRAQDEGSSSQAELIGHRLAETLLHRGAMAVLTR
jgi:hydroxymethylbilane synthase